MKHRLHIFAFLTLAVLLPTISWSQEGTSDGPLPKVHIIATGGTIAGTCNVGYKGIVFAGVGDGNLNQATLDLAAKAVESGVMIVRSSRIPYGGVYTEGGEVDDEKLGFIASGSLNPQKSRILLMLALTATRDIGVIRSYFRQGVFTQVVELPGVSNARQLGGYIIGDKKVRMDLLLRSGNLSKASDEAIASLRDKYRLSLVADFRSSMERGKAPDRDVEGATNVWLPVLEKMISSEGASSVMASLHFNKDNPSNIIELLHRQDIQDALSASYDAIVFDEDYQQSYAAFLDSLVALPEDRAALWHCTHGKDRCGWGTAFVLAALGADRSLIVDDFSKSNISYAQEIEELTAVARAEGSKDELIEYIHLLRGVSVAFFEKTLDAIDARYGSIDNFLEQELDLTADEKRILRDKFLENR